MNLPIVENNITTMKKRIILNYPNLILTLITIITGYLIFYFFQRNNFGVQFFAILTLLGLSWAALLIDKIFKIRFPDFLYLIYYLFLILAIFFGEILNFYYLFSWYDNLVHLVGGFFLTILGMYIIVKIDNIGYLKFIVLITYSIFFVGFASAVWEIFEYFVDRILKLNLQTGIGDVIIDITLAIIGSIILSIFLIIDNSMYNSRYIEKIVKRF